MKLSLTGMPLAIHQAHGCEAKDCIEVVKIKSGKAGATIEIDDYSFEVEGHPSASRCFLWGAQKNSNRVSVAAALMHPVRYKGRETDAYLRLQDNHLNWASR
ncbi:MAG: hypothetical protein ABI830_10005 [Pseudolabrys sp.]